MSSQDDAPPAAEGYGEYYQQFAAPPAAPTSTAPPPGYGPPEAMYTERARYGSRYSRRYAWTFAVIAATQFGLLAQIDLLPTSTVRQLAQVPTGAVVAYLVVVVMISAALWTLLVALFPGRAKPRMPGVRLLAFAVGVLLLVGLAFLLSARLTSAAVVTTDATWNVASPRAGCQEFVRAAETVGSGRYRTSEAGVLLASLGQAATEKDPALARDLSGMSASTTPGDLKAATTAVLSRCVSKSYLTPIQASQAAEAMGAALP